MFFSTSDVFAMVSHEFHIAPMQCYTNQPFRKLAGYLSPTSIKYTEMEKVDDLLPNIEASLHKRLDGEQDDSNLVLQLGSNDVDKLAKCVRIASSNYPNLREVNLNCGCPAINTGGASTYGALLMKDPSLTSQLVESMCSVTDIDISVKCRIGVFDNTDNVHTLDETDYTYLSNYISSIHDAGTKHVILHARPAILSLNPVKNRQIPKLNYEVVNRIAADFNGMKITMNGGINSLDELSSFQKDATNSNIQSHMSGRWILRRPLDLIQIEQSLDDNRLKMDPIKGIERYIDYALANVPNFPISELCLPFYLIVEQLREDYDQKEETLLSWEDMESMHDIIQDGLIQLGSDKVNTSFNFKKLATSFKSLVGKKVVNKWKRNRSEL